MTLLETDHLEDVERRFDPSSFSRNGLLVLDGGELSTVLVHRDWPDLVLKRIHGFTDRESALAHAGLIRQYCDHLTGVGVPTITTQPTVVGGSPYFSVYVVQSRVPHSQLGKSWLLTASRSDIVMAVEQLAGFSLNALEPLVVEGRHLDCTIDAQISNWRIHDGAVAELLDVSTPLLRYQGRLLFDDRLVLNTLPPLVRTALHKTRQVDKIYDVHFSVRGNLTDIVANLLKEQRADLVPAAVQAANTWLRRTGLPGISVNEVRKHYSANARALEITHRLRRIDAWARRLLGLRQHAVVPPKVQR